MKIIILSAKVFPDIRDNSPLLFLLPLHSPTMAAQATEKLDQLDRKYLWDF
jgi:hypothetical protein